MKRPIAICAALGLFAVLACAFVAHGPAWAVQRVDYRDLTSQQLLATDEIRNSTQDVQVVGDRIIIRMTEPNPAGGYYRWQVVYRAVTTFQLDGTGQRQFVALTKDMDEDDRPEDMDIDPRDNWREQFPSRQRWEAHRNQLRGGLTDDEREQIRALGESR